MAAFQADGFQTLIKQLHREGVRSSVFVVVDALRYRPHPRVPTASWRLQVSGRNPEAVRELSGCGTPPTCRGLTTNRYTLIRYAYVPL